MLLQSHDGRVSLLPALPKEWTKGSVKGIKGRGNFEVAMSWANGKLTKANIHSGSGGLIRLRTLTPVKIVETKSQKVQGRHNNRLLSELNKPPYKNNTKTQLKEINTSPGYEIDFETQRGKTYTIMPI